MDKLVWCAVNISEGRDQKTIQHIKNLFQLYKNVSLQHVDVGADVNRSVFSFFATQTALPLFVNAFFQLALSSINMKHHTGSHPRIGAVDVFPFVPLNNSTPTEIHSLVKRLSEQLATDFGLPIYLYEDSQEQAYRKQLEQIRKGNYEALPKKMKQPGWIPDFGPVDFQPEKGATVMGLRKPLVAVNFTLKSGNESVASSIAKAIRASNTSSTHSLPGVKAIGWYIPEYKQAQVSVNITDSQKTSFKHVFDTINLLAKKQNRTIVELSLIHI